jgi:hypothetical protein
MPPARRDNRNQPLDPYANLVPDPPDPYQRSVVGDWSSCIAGALSRSEYLQGLTTAGFTDATVEFTSPYAEDMHAAIIRAHRP